MTRQSSSLWAAFVVKLCHVPFPPPLCAEPGHKRPICVPIVVCSSGHFERNRTFNPIIGSSRQCQRPFSADETSHLAASYKGFGHCAQVSIRRITVRKCFAFSGDVTGQSLIGCRYRRGPRTKKKKKQQKLAGLAFSQTEVVTTCSQKYTGTIFLSWHKRTAQQVSKAAKMALSSMRQVYRSSAIDMWFRNVQLIFTGKLRMF